MEKLVVNADGSSITECLGMPLSRMVEIHDTVVKIDKETEKHTDTMQKAWDAFEDEKEKVIAVWMAGEVMGMHKILRKLIGT
jgi:hypothetical protein